MCKRCEQIRASVKDVKNNGTKHSSYYFKDSELELTVWEEVGPVWNYDDWNVDECPYCKADLDQVYERLKKKGCL